VGESTNTALALRAWKQAKKTFQQYDILYSGMIIHHDRDPVFTGYGWTGELLLSDGVRLSYALGGAKDNPEMESFFFAQAFSKSLIASRLRDTHCSWMHRILMNSRQLWIVRCITTILSVGTPASHTCRL
jgi:hypothetical protein